MKLNSEQLEFVAWACALFCTPVALAILIFWMNHAGLIDLMPTTQKLHIMDDCMIVYESKNEINIEPCVPGGSR